jgi:hypothetical protein
MRSTVLVITALLTLTTSAIARDITPAEKRVFPYDTQIPACHDVAVLEKIASYFAEKEAKYWQSSLRIAEYEQIRPVAWRPWGLDYIPRRFCHGKVITTDGVKRRIDYSVREDLAVIGVSWGVEWCVHGLDRNWAYEPACQMARP